MKSSKSRFFSMDEIERIEIGSSFVEFLTKFDLKFSEEVLNAPVRAFLNPIPKETRFNTREKNER